VFERISSATKRVGSAGEEAILGLLSDTSA
jgi:hypothetical protein